MPQSIASFSLGFKKFLAGFSFLLARPKLWWLAVVPLAISIVMFIVMVGAFFHYYADLHTWILSQMGHLHIDSLTAWWVYIVNALLWIVNGIISVLVVLVSVLLILIVFYAVTMIIASPFNDLLSERVEEIVTGKESPPFSLTRLIRETGHTMWVELLKGLLFLAVPLVMLILLVLPVVGGPLYLVVTILFGMWDLGFTYIDYPMGRQLMSFGERLRTAWRHKTALAGFGAIFIVPFASFFLIAPMTVGGTLLYLECIEQKERSL